VQTIRSCNGILRHAKPHVTKGTLFDPAVLEAMQQMQATLDVLEKSPATAQRTRRGGRVAECGGLLNPPALFALADFHAFSIIYDVLSCFGMLPFAGYSAPRVHQSVVGDSLPIRAF